MLSYAVKRISRSWKLFAALAVGITIASTFFSGLNVAADTVGKQALDAQLVNTPVDVTLSPMCGGFGPCNSGLYQTSSVTAVTNSVKSVQGVLTAEPVANAWSNNGSYPGLRGIDDSSILYSHMTLVSGRKVLHANETLINVDSPQAQQFPLNSRARYGLSAYQNGSTTVFYNVSLTVVGTVSLDTVAASSLGIGYSQCGPGICTPIPPPSVQQQSIFVVSWQQTFVPFLDWVYGQYQKQSVKYYFYTPNSLTVNIYLDRNGLISPFSVENSISQIQQVEARISLIASQYGFRMTDNLLNQLQNFSQEIFALRVQFTIVSIPVFFLAWYVGRTVSQSSFNLRRKEIGLLLTRGFTGRQLFIHFLTEGLLIGIIAGVAGVLLAYALNPAFIWALGGSSGGAFLTSDTVIVSVLFALILTFVSIFSPARQAAAMDPAQALREYVYLEDVRPGRKRGAIAAFSLGLFQLILLLLGINYQNIGRYFYNANFFIAIILIFTAILSFVLTYIGPFLFLYGAAQLSTGAAQRFHRAFGGLAKRIIGDVSVLASRSVFRNPRRVAALVFIVALIIGYSVWVIGDLASQQDYNYRQAEVQNLSDLHLSGINSIANASRLAGSLSGWSNITGATPETDFSGDTPFGSLQIKAIDPATWRAGSYYEPGWFTGDTDGVFSELKMNNQSIILDRGVASYYSLGVGTSFQISYSIANGTGASISRVSDVTVVGFFGPDYSRYSGPYGGYFQPEGWSFVPLQFLNHNVSKILAPSLVLARASPGTSLTQLAQSVQHDYPGLSVITPQFNVGGVAGIVNAGGQNVLRLGTAFAGLASSIGVGVVAYTGYREREKEITMIAVRGLSYRQLLGLLVTEFLPLILFSLILGTIVGLIVVWGDAQGQNSLNPGYLELLAGRRVVYPVWALLNILAIMGALIAGVFLPAIMAARKDLSKMNRTVRFA